ncbi:2-amino-4-hydroxy-6-hydroxymethyldihydropteridine diphosphokinase [Synechococcus sp. AH-736-G21]|nr:2-amino-4-hydroxy-6-hydroxymethyldihydropteridine diphosphokinase [Synechococcus sp. AH-736-G21]
MPPNDDACVAVALGANQPSAAGSPRQTLLAVRPELEAEFVCWGKADLCFRWSALHDNAAVGGPPDQPRYCNAVVLVEGVAALPIESMALDLLDRLQAIERRYGRDRSKEQRWGPRSLDLDLLFWGAFRLDHTRLVLPHPRLHLRPFVLVPLVQVMGS